MPSSFRAVVIVGPTASGKTALAHGLADMFRSRGLPAELVNLDAFQFYRGVDAGTAKPAPAEREQYNYHCLDFLGPEEGLDAAHYARMAWDACSAIVARGAVPVCVGGSGLYLRAFLHGLDELPRAHEPLRRFFRECAANEGWAQLHGWLAAVDPVRAAELHPNDGVRIERALEIYFQTGTPMSSLRSRTEKLDEQRLLFPGFVVHQDAPDELLRERIRMRLPLMVEQGWREEVLALHARFGEALTHFPSMRAIGYPDILDCVRRGVPVDTQVLTRIETATWQYAKRQRTWNAKERQDARCLAGDEALFRDTLEKAWRWWHETS